MKLKKIMKIKKIKYLFPVFLLIILATAGAYAQDAFFSQYYHNPLYTNAALTGGFDGKYRVGFNYRSQWYSVTPDVSYTTGNIFFDAKFNIYKNDFFSAGIMIFDDRAGGSTARLGQAQWLAGISYAKHLYHDKYSKTNQYLVFGVQAGIGKMFLDYSGYLFGIQFDKSREEVDETAPVNEPLLSSKAFPDVNLGLMWYISKPGRSFFIAAGVSHVTKPDISLVKGTSYPLYMRYHLFTGGELDISEGIYILPSIYFNVQGPHTLLLGGMNFRIQYHNHYDNAFRVGLWTKYGDGLSGFALNGLIVSTILETKGLEVGLSYDISTGRLANLDNRRGAFEISTIYIWGEKPKRHTVSCPRF